MSTTEVKLKNVRIAFCQSLFVAQKFDENDPKGKAEHCATFLFAPDHPAVELIKAATRQAAIEKWGPEKAMQVLQQLAAQDRLALHNGDLKSQFDGYAGNLFVNSRNKTRPRIVDVDGKRQLMESDGRPYAGCYVNAMIQLWAQDHQKYGKRINASLMGVQFLRHGDAFGGGRVADENAFEDYSAEYGSGEGDAGFDDMSNNAAVANLI